jgi:hypothetical protein
MFFRKEYHLIHLFAPILYELWFLNTTSVWTRAGAGSLSRNFSIPAPAPAKSFGSLRLRLPNTELWLNILL